MKRTQQPTNTSTSTNTDTDTDTETDAVSVPVPLPPNPKRSRDTENKEHLVLDNQNFQIPVSMAMSVSRGCQIDEGNVVVGPSSSSRADNRESGSGYNRPIKTPKPVDEEQQKQPGLPQQQEQEQEQQHEEQQETNMKALSSLLTLQRTEINQLKSQVVKHQEQIDELNAKLQLNVENQPPQIRDCPTKVLSRIFAYLNLKSLKQSRLVCRRWREEAGKILLSNFYLVCSDYGRDENVLINWLRKSYPMSTATSGKLWSRYQNAQGTLQLLRKSKRLRNSITELVFSARLKSDTGNLYEILQQLPNLQVLETTTLDLGPIQKWLRDDPIGHTGIKVKLEELIQKLGTLKKLKLNFWMSRSFVKQFLGYHQQFSSIQSLEIHRAGLDFMRLYLEDHVYSWAITRFGLSISQEHYKAGMIRSFLERISPNLEHLQFHVRPLKSDASSSCPEPWTDDWLIPLSLTRVETLEIEGIFSREELDLKGIVAALQLPRLKTLTVAHIPVELEQVIQHWESHESARGRKLQSESLEELELSSWLTSNLNSRKIPRHPWPGLKSLKCVFQMSEEPFGASFLSELTNLERLELNIHWERSFNKNTDNKDEAGENGNSQSQSPQFQLRDLKNLKNFHLTFWGGEETYQSFINFLQEKNLKFMKSLQVVQLNFINTEEGPV